MTLWAGARDSGGRVFCARRFMTTQMPFQTVVNPDREKREASIKSRAEEELFGRFIKRKRVRLFDVAFSVPCWLQLYALCALTEKPRSQQGLRVIAVKGVLGREPNGFLTENLELPGSISKPC